MEKKLEVWGIEPQASTMLKLRSTTELYSLSNCDAESVY